MKPRLAEVGFDGERLRTIPLDDPRVYDSDTILGMTRLPRTLRPRQGTFSSPRNHNLTAGSEEALRVASSTAWPTRPWTLHTH